MSLFPNVKEYYHKHWLKKKKYDWGDFEYLLQKGQFPYEHIKSSEVFDEKVLPDKSAFRNRLKDASHRSNMNKLKIHGPNLRYFKFKVFPE